MIDDCYLPLTPLKQYSGICVRKLRDHIADPVDPIPAFKVNGRLLVKKSEFDRWMARRRVAASVDTIVDDVLRDLTTDKEAVAQGGGGGMTTDRPRYCRRGHELIPGETAYVASRWVGRQLYTFVEAGTLYRTEACDGGALHGWPCRYGGPEEHARLESDPGAGGTRVEGHDEAGRTLWQHRVLEWRCRECNRQRVAAHRARNAAQHRPAHDVIGSSTATNYTGQPA